MWELLEEDGDAAAGERIRGVIALQACRRAHAGASAIIAGMGKPPRFPTCGRAGYRLTVPSGTMLKTKGP
jgi:hypothetical protein